MSYSRENESWQRLAVMDRPGQFYDSRELERSLEHAHRTVYGKFVDTVSTFAKRTKCSSCGRLYG